MCLAKVGASVGRKIVTCWQSLTPIWTDMTQTCSNSALFYSICTLCWHTCHSWASLDPWLGCCHPTAALGPWLGCPCPRCWVSSIPQLSLPCGWASIASWLPSPHSHPHPMDAFTPGLGHPYSMVGHPLPQL